MCMAQIKSFYVIRYASVMVWLNGCCLVSGCLHRLMTWIVCVCVCVHVRWWKQAESCTSPVLCWPAPSGTLRKSSACAVGTVGAVGTTTKETVFAHWVDYCHYYASSVWLCWVVFTLQRRATLALWRIQKDLLPRVYSSQREQGPNICSQLKEKSYSKSHSEDLRKWMRVACSATHLYDQIGSMFRQQKVIITFSTGYFSSTDSFGESTETNWRNAHNFSNSQICALPVTLFREYRIKSKRLSDHPLLHK